MPLERVVHELPRLSQAEVRRQFPDLVFKAESGDPVPDYVARQHILPRGSVFVAADVDEPFVCRVSIYGHPTYAVVTRERGAVEYPAYVAHVKQLARTDIHRIVRRVAGDVLDWLEEGERKRRVVAATPENDPGTHYAALANGEVSPE